MNVDVMSLLKAHMNMREVRVLPTWVQTEYLSWTHAHIPFLHTDGSFIPPCRESKGM
jgi:hypothetical protein